LENKLNLPKDLQKEEEVKTGDVELLNITEEQKNEIISQDEQL
jgi:hypothetical protein